MIEVETKPQVNASNFAAKAWLRALEMTAPIARRRDRIMPAAIEELANRYEDAPALLSERECFSYCELANRANRYARWAMERGLEKGDVVGLLMTNRPEYFAAWLGLTKAGVVVALLNTNLVGVSLSHCVNVVRPKHLIASSELVPALMTALPGITDSSEVWVYGEAEGAFPRIDLELEQQVAGRLSQSECPQMTIDDRALYIFTSGTTGLPKAVILSHARVMQWSYWFAGMMGVGPADRMYSCLPMYHSIGGVLAPGAVLAGGGSIVLKEKFSASQFWSDVARWDCTIFQYIGELCRYLLHAPSASSRPPHRLRLACGNGLAPDVWDEFKDRFGIPRILEFYASTEGGVSLFNAEEKRGAIGRVPPYLAHRFSPALVRFDVENGEPLRDEKGLCVRCGADEPGEALGRASDDPGSRFEGYTDERASERKILRDVFERGDKWIRTGDLMRKDEKGFFYFVDRIGDTFRWKGENVATSEVAEAVCGFPGVKQANVYGVAIPGTQGRAGMAAVVAVRPLDLAEFRKHLISRLPVYARPVFLRLQDDLEVTGTFKYSKSELIRQGYDPQATADTIYFDNPESQAFERLDGALYARIQSGRIRL